MLEEKPKKEEQLEFSDDVLSVKSEAKDLASADFSATEEKDCPVCGGSGSCYACPEGIARAEEFKRQTGK